MMQPVRGRWVRRCANPANNCGISDPASLSSVHTAAATVKTDS